MSVQKASEILETLGKGEKAWYTTPTEIYKYVKNMASNIPKGQQFVEKSISSISDATKYINESTRLNVAVDQEQTYQLINKLDELVSEQMIRLDDGLDDARGRFATSLRSLMNALVAQKNRAEEYAKNTRSSAANAVKTRYEQVQAMLQSLLVKVREIYPEGYDQVAAIAHSSIEKAVELQNSAQGYVKATTNKVHGYAHSTIFGTVQYLLKTAHPYVHMAVVTGQPYYYKALDASGPYIVSAKPYVDPLIERAEHVKDSLHDSKLLGPYIDTAFSYAEVVINETKNYAIPPEASQ